MKVGDTVWMLNGEGRHLCLITGMSECGWFEILCKGQVIIWPEQQLEVINE
jgi:hypothetical protein